MNLVSRDWKLMGVNEYISIQFSQFCEKEGIVYEIIPFYIREHNGIAGRKNKSILNMERSMPQARQLPNHFSRKATSTIIHIINRFPKNKLMNHRPYEAQTILNPSVAHFIIFGSFCLRHVREKLRRKRDDRSQTMTLISYHSTSIYKLFSSNENNMIICKDVNFDESK